MKILLVALLFVQLSVSYVFGEVQQSDGPKVLKDDGAEDVFLDMLGHGIYDNSNPVPYLVVILSSVGCPGCYTFRMQKQNDFVERFKSKADIYSVDYFLEKADLTAMALVAALPKKQQAKAREVLLAHQDQWMRRDLVAALEQLLQKHGIIINSALREKWNSLRVRELEQRKFLDTICKIKYLPYFIVVDRHKKRVVLCDTCDVAENVLEGGV